MSFAGGFIEGFTKTYNAAKEREEERRQFDETLKLKRQEMILRLAPEFAKASRSSGRSGGGGGGGDDDDIEFSLQHSYKILAAMEVPDVKIGTLYDAGGVKAVSKAAEILQSADYLTPTMIEQFMDSAIVTTTESPAIDWGPLVEAAGLTHNELDDITRLSLDLMGSPESYTEVDFMYDLPEKYKPAEIAQIRQGLTKNFTEFLQENFNSTSRQMDEAMKAGNSELAKSLLEEKRRLEIALAEVKADNIAGAIPYVSDDLVMTWVEDLAEEHPILANGGQSLGYSLDKLIDRYQQLKNPEPEVPAAQPAPVVDVQPVAPDVPTGEEVVEEVSAPPGEKAGFFSLERLGDDFDKVKRGWKAVNDYIDTNTPFTYDAPMGIENKPWEPGMDRDTVKAGGHTDRNTPTAPPPQVSAYTGARPRPSQAAIDYLRTNPVTAGQFDAKFGDPQSNDPYERNPSKRYLQ